MGDYILVAGGVLIGAILVMMAIMCARNWFRLEIGRKAMKRGNLYRAWKEFTEVLRRRYWVEMSEPSRSDQFNQALHELQLLYRQLGFELHIDELHALRAQWHAANNEHSAAWDLQSNLTTKAGLAVSGCRGEADACGDRSPAGTIGGR
jgi:hypothetical protein